MPISEAGRGEGGRLFAMKDEKQMAFHGGKIPGAWKSDATRYYRQREYGRSAMNQRYFDMTGNIRTRLFQISHLGLGRRLY